MESDREWWWYRLNYGAHYALWWLGVPRRGRLVLLFPLRMFAALLDLIIISITVLVELVKGLVKLARALGRGLAPWP